MEMSEGCRERKLDSRYFVGLPDVPSESMADAEGGGG